MQMHASAPSTAASLPRAAGAFERTVVTRIKREMAAPAPLTSRQHLSPTICTTRLIDMHAWCHCQLAVQLGTPTSGTSSIVRSRNLSLLRVVYGMESFAEWFQRTKAPFGTRGFFFFYSYKNELIYVKSFTISYVPNMP